MPLVASPPDHASRTWAMPPVASDQVGPVAVGATVSRTIVSVFGVVQLPAPSRHLAQTVRVPFVAGSVQAWLAAYGRVVQVTPSFDSATWLTPVTGSVAAVETVTAVDL